MPNRRQETPDTSTRCQGSGLPPQIITERATGYGTIPQRGTCRRCGREFALNYSRGGSGRVRKHNVAPASEGEHACD